MKKPAYYFLGFLLSVFVLVGIVEHPAMAQDKAKAQNGKSTVKVLFNDDRVRVVEVTYKPGDESRSRIRPFRVVRPLISGTLQRIYVDGKIEILPIKAGEMKFYEADKKPFSTRNVGTADLVFYVVTLGMQQKIARDQFVNESQISP